MKAIYLLVLTIVFLSAPPQTIAAPPSDDAPQQTADRSKREKDLAERLSNARMIGFYVTEGQNGPPQQDSYTLGKVDKADGDKWTFQARIEFNKKTLTVPLEIPIYWANETPVITVTDFTIPGMGTYTARVMIHGDHYAGTWSSPNHGGYLWGRIQKIPPGSATESPRQREEKKESQQ
jgi:hypothetical protein